LENRKDGFCILKDQGRFEIENLKGKQAGPPRQRQPMNQTNRGPFVSLNGQVPSRAMGRR
jgi:hypothetical protein